MLTVPSLRHRYTQFFVLFMLCAGIYMMVQSIGLGVQNFQDHLYKKSFLIEKANSLRIKLGDRILPITLIGKDGWSDYTGEGNIDDFQNLEPLKNKREISLRLKALNHYLKSQDITFLLVVAPNKATIYPDKLPEQIKSLPTQSRLDQLMTYLKNNHLPIIVDVRPALRAARANQDVFFKENNTHWNGYGAFVTYTTIISALGSSHPELKPYQIADLKLMPADRSLAMPGPYFALPNPFVQTLRLSEDQGQSQYYGTEYGYNQFSFIPDGTLPTLLMFHDSFGAYYLNDYLSMNFAESHFIHLYNAPQYLSREAIQQFKPDIVIIEIVERNLDNLINVLVNFAPK